MNAGQPRARGAVRLSVKARGPETVLDGLRQAGSLKALFPRVGGGAGMQAVLVNTAGGITGGDRISVEARARPDTHLTLTTQAAERAYRASAGEVGRLTTRLFADRGARLNWLPQETILFDGCALDRALTVEMAADASLLLVEPLVFGRAAMGEVVSDAAFRDRIEIRRQGRLLFLDAMDLTGDVAAHLAHPFTGSGAGAMATLVFVDRGAEAQLDLLRALLPDTAGASLIGEDVLVLRLLAADSHLLRHSLVPILNRLTQDTLPRPWMI